MKIWDLEGIGRNECSILFPSLKLPNKGMVFSFHSIPSYLNFQTGEWKEYSYFSIPFHSIPFPPPKRSVRGRKERKRRKKTGEKVGRGALVDEIRKKNKEKVGQHCRK
jgi:hypothetical protein